MGWRRGGSSRRRRGGGRVVSPGVVVVGGGAVVGDGEREVVVDSFVVGSVGEACRTVRSSQVVG